MQLSTRVKRMLATAVIALSITACQQGGNKADKPVADTTAKAAPAAKEYPVSLVNNKKDPTCGMPVTAGIGDTAHYKDKVIGFCSAECKAEFVKNPEAGIVAAELK